MKAPFEVIYEDNHLLIVNKASGILVQGDATGDVPLVELCKEYVVKDINIKISEKQQELLLLEARIEAMVNSFKVTEADAYYARARAVEEAAKRTKLAPQKKNDTYREALELYKRALSLGKQEAKEDIADLEKKIK